MSKTITSRYDVSELLRTPEEMAAYLEASMFIAPRLLMGVLGCGRPVLRCREKSAEKVRSEVTTGCHAREIDAPERVRCWRRDQGT